MVWHALLQSTNLSLALIPTDVDRIVVWGALALVIVMIAWREYTLPEIASPLMAPNPERIPAAKPVPEAAAASLSP